MKHLFFALTVPVISLFLAACQPSGPQGGVAPTAPTVAPKTASISGTIKINGAVPQNSTVLMLQRQPGEAEYTEFDRLPAVDGTAWSFTQAIAGQKYDLTAAGQVDEQNRVVANAVTVTAPSSDLVLTLNSKLSLPEPKSKPSVSCGDPDGTNHFNAKLTFAAVEDAKQYYATVGTSSGGDDVASELLPARVDQAAELTVYVAKETDYFTRYAYTFCTDCDQEDRQNWSGFSPTLGFRCP